MGVEMLSRLRPSKATLQGMAITTAIIIVLAAVVILLFRYAASSAPQPGSVVAPHPSPIATVRPPRS